ncbi:hypothetical protein ACWF2L_11580 [Streptomyces anulatus]
MKLRTPDLAVRRIRIGSSWLTAALAATLAATMVAVTPSPALAIATPVPLVTADSFAVLAGESVTTPDPP